ncbi:MAG: hypothetical protein F4024_00505, partial [Gammaproteobacteria bacterium]|nr:hypothetical protein [Gammaproteobacteria bacterium]
MAFRLPMAAAVAVMVLVSPLAVHGQHPVYADLGVSRAELRAMMEEEGLNPTLNERGQFEGHPVNDLLVWSPHIKVTMYGPDEALTAIEVSTRPSTDQSEAYWQGFVCQGVLEAVFPEWASSDKWLERTLGAFASGTAKDAVSFRRGDIKVAAFLDKFGLLLSVE